MHKINIIYGPRRELIKYIRKLDKKTYDIISTMYFLPKTDTEPEPESAHGSYDLFRPTSLKFHLITDYTPLYYDALIAYVKEEHIILPRALGGGRAPACKDRIPIIILMDEALADTNIELSRDLDSSQLQLISVANVSEA